ncbi:aromatic ring-hydroxylating dioxygenase subunit alpha [Novosphingobium flavum]|uniref:aromatic ring-hydroxylating dioxygenase subunit alpha n=1 Tax=Novosphingobium aerophilum TaxID=2839843 RepID=UPI00163B0F14|nr:aromatic ring-hydroxylating dioxygenase subunit alpha [Novosphingobium aerophilum]MBC2663522.1 aromatic ring-hydroxylating dioxygenase subunit alpha [Novosphingobium aerophilum]
MPFVRNAWYVAGFSEEVPPGQMLSRRVLDCPLVILRGSDGTLSAMVDQCPHRFAPLSLGSFDGGTVTCRYHGLGFELEGRCVSNPHGSTAGLATQTWPVREQDGLLWVWPGDVAERLAIAPPKFGMLDEAEAFVRRGYLHGNADYRLMVDNILDLSHIEFLHPALGTPAVRNAEVRVTVQEDAITVTRAMSSEQLGEGLSYVYGTSGEAVNRTMTVTWSAPSNLVLTVDIERGVGPTGSQSLHLFTPETDRSTHYFYTASMSRRVADPDQFDSFANALAGVFLTEDKPMIDAQQDRIGHRELATLKPALLKIDKAPVLARRRLEQLIALETAGRA